MTTYRTMCRHIFAVSKQVALAYKCVILGKPHWSTFLFHQTVQHTWVDHYKSTWNLVLKTLKKTGISHQKPWENWEFCLLEKVRTLALIHQPRPEDLVYLPLIHQSRAEGLVCLPWIRPLIHQPRPEGLVCVPWSTSSGQRALCVCPDPSVPTRGPCVYPDPPVQARGPCVFALIHHPRPEGLVCLPWSTCSGQRTLCLILQDGREGLVCLPWSTSPGQSALCVCPDPLPQARGPCVFALIHQLRPEDLVCLILQAGWEGLVCLPWYTSPGQRALCVYPDPPAQDRGPCVFVLIHQPRPEHFVCLPLSTRLGERTLCVFPISTIPGQRALFVCPDPPAQARGLCKSIIIYIYIYIYIISGQFPNYILIFISTPFHPVKWTWGKSEKLFINTTWTNCKLLALSRPWKYLPTVPTSHS